MVRALVTAALAAAFAAGFVAAAPPKCNRGNKCPSETPCCSQYGQCGVGAYCLGGCDPLSSHSLESCVAAPACKSGDYKLSSLSDISPNTKYLGDGNKANWVSEGKPVVYDNKILLTMAPDTVGTLLASTHYVWYGKISGTFTTSRGKGVVTAFIMMSDVKDEIDFEFVGADVEHAQSNYYHLGIIDYTNSENLTVSNTAENVHTYTIDWKPESITWSIDGKEMRKLVRSDTYNSTTKQFDYPATPARVMISLWPAGISSNGKGTIDWAGGMIDWNSQYMQNGYYYAMIQGVTVDCYDPPANAKKSGSQAYVYTDNSGLEGSIEITDKSSTLASFYASGEKPNYDPNAAKSSAAANSKTSSAASEPSELPETIPGMTGAGQRGEDAESEDSSTSSGGDGDEEGSSTSDGDSAGPTPSDDGTGSTSFTQGGGSTGSNGNNSNAATQERVVSGSVFAVVIAVLGLLVL